VKRLGLLLLLLAGCSEPMPVAPQLVSTPQAPGDSSIALTVLSTTDATVYSLTVRGYGHYDQVSGWFVTGTFSDSLLLHGVYYGEEIPNAHDYLWLSIANTSQFVAVVEARISRSAQADFLDVAIPFAVVPPSPRYTLRVWRIDEAGLRAGILQEFAGTLMGRNGDPT
jgi:hypothetical protein